MEQFERGDEWWGLREDGTWVRWNRATMEWEPQTEAPPRDELRASSALPTAASAELVAHHAPLSSESFDQRMKRRRAARLAQGFTSFRQAEAMMAIIFMAGIVALAYLISWAFENLPG